MLGNHPLRYQCSSYTAKLIQGLLVLLLCVPACVDSKVYQWQDAKGSQHFSDRFYPDAKTVDIKPGYGFYTVKTVYDGDTVELEDDRKIRLLGINTPEIQHKDKMPEAGGEEAKTWLINKLQHAKVRLEFDVEKTDKYGRTLAYLFSENKEHINLSLVKAGLATVSIYPPNLLYANELLAAENKAEQDKLGIWQRPEYAAIPVSNLTDAGHHGWSRLVGRVIDIHNTQNLFTWCFPVSLKRVLNANGCPCFLMLMTIWVKLSKSVLVEQQQKAFFTINPSPSAIRQRESR